MSAPADPSYNSALKWAQENSNKTTRSGSEDYFSWLFLGIIILIIIVGYFCVVNHGRPIERQLLTYLPTKEKNEIALGYKVRVMEIFFLPKEAVLLEFKRVNGSGWLTVP